MPATLHTFKSCPHFICTATTPLPLPHLLANFPTLYPQSLATLSIHPITHHTSTPTACPLCTNQAPFPITKNPAQRTKVIQDIGTAAKDIRTLLQHSKVRYQKLGKLYHHIPLTGRTKTAQLPAAALAHQQFGVNCMSLSQDPFFGAAVGTETKVAQIENWLAGADADAEALSSAEVVEGVIAEVNAARAEYSRHVAVLQRLGPRC